MHARIAALDLGSNSFHLAVYTTGPGRRFTQVARKKEKVRLGRTVFRDGSIAADEYREGLSAIGALREVMQREAVERVLAVATSAVREADNGPRFVAEASALLGSPIQIIDGHEEARLVGLGISHALASSGRVLVCDLGGGSLELATMQGARCVYSTSLPIGTLRSRPQLAAGALPTLEQLAAVEASAAATACEALREARRRGFDQVALSCGSARALWRLTRSALLFPERAPDGELTRACLASVSRQLLSQQMSGSGAELTSAELEKLLVAAAIFAAVMDELGVHAVEISSGSLREGLIADYLARRELLVRAPAPSAIAL